MAPIDQFFVQGILLLFGHQINSQHIVIIMCMIIVDHPDAATIYKVVFLTVKARYQICQFINEGLDRDVDSVFVHRELVCAILDSKILGDHFLENKERVTDIHHKLLRPARQSTTTDPPLSLCIHRSSPIGFRSSLSFVVFVSISTTQRSITSLFTWTVLDVPAWIVAFVIIRFYVIVTGAER
jgi:hypothetical protein